MRRNNYADHTANRGSQDDFDSMMLGIQSRANTMKQLAVHPAGESEVGSEQWQSAFLDASKDTFLDVIEDENLKLFVGSTFAHAIESYHDSFNQLPDDEVLASAYQQMEFMVNDARDSGGKGVGLLLDAAGEGISTTAGVETLARNIMLVMPVMLEQVTLAACTPMPSDKDKARIYHMEYMSASNFADTAKGDIIAEGHTSSFSYMNPMFEIGVTDGTNGGTAGDFLWDSATDTKGKIALPAVKNSVKVYVDGQLCGTASGAGFTGSYYSESNDTTYTLTGTADYDAGTYDPKFDADLPAGLKVFLSFDIDIEANPELIPKIDAHLSYWELTPHENAIRATSTIQAYFRAIREHNVDVVEVFLKALTNLLAKNRDNHRLKAFYRFATGVEVFDTTVPSGISRQEHYETFSSTINTVDTKLMDRTKVAGVAGYYADRKAANFLRDLPGGAFKLLPNYTNKPQPHLLGHINGKPVFVDPDAESRGGKSGGICCYAKGQSFGETGYVTGQAVPATYYSHSVGEGLRKTNTVYEQCFDDVHPKNGGDYFMWIEIQ